MERRSAVKMTTWTWERLLLTKVISRTLLARSLSMVSRVMTSATSPTINTMMASLKTIQLSRSFESASVAPPAIEKQKIGRVPPK